MVAARSPRRLCDIRSCPARSREREEEAVPRKSERDLKREKEEEEEAKERKKLDRKAREKEAAYQVCTDTVVFGVNFAVFLVACSCLIEKAAAPLLKAFISVRTSYWSREVV